MPGLSELARAARDGLAFLRVQPGVREVEVFVSENRTLLTRLNYTSHIPCNGVEEPKSVESYGLGIQIMLDGPDGKLVGFGSEPSDLSVAGAAKPRSAVASTAVATRWRTAQPPARRARLRIVGPPLPSFLLCMGCPLPQFGIG